MFITRERYITKRLPTYSMGGIFDYEELMNYRDFETELYSLQLKQLEEDHLTESVKDLLGKGPEDKTYRLLID